MKKEILESNIRPNENQLVKVTISGDVTEIMWCERVNHDCPITKLSDEEYILNATGEVKEFENKATTRLDNIKSVSHSLKRLRDLINSNVYRSNLSSVRWVTLTYSENMTDTKRLYKDYERFWKRFKYRYGNNIEYIIACEPQGRGAWHIHALFIWQNCNAPYIPNEELRRLWGQGFVRINALDNCDNIGAYLTAYLGDMDLQEAIDNKCFSVPVGITADNFVAGGDVKLCTVTDANGNKVEKKYVKGMRLRMYPADFNLYRFSRGVKKPVIEYMCDKEAQKKVSADTLTYEKTVALSDDDFINTINYRYYNSIR